MLINKIGNPRIQTFKGYNHEIDENGKRLLRFNFPIDYTKIKGENAKIEFYELADNESDPTGYVKAQQNSYTVLLDGEKGTLVDLTRSAGFGKNSTFGYRFIINGNPVLDSGMVRNVEGTDLNIVNRNSTTPLNQGAAVLIMPKTHRPGAQYAEDGTIDYSHERQKIAEESVNTFSSTPGGSLAGVQYDIKSLSEKGFKHLFLNPVVGADSMTHHGYSAENNYQLAPQMGTAENYNSFLVEAFRYGVEYVYDATVASEGLLGNHFKYSLRWADKNPQSYYWFKMNGIKHGPLKLGVVPNNKENLRHKIINPPVIYDAEKNKVVKNREYNPNAETIIQIYDKSRVTPEQEKSNELITKYKKVGIDEALDINTHDDTMVPYYYNISPLEYKDRLERFVEFKKDVDNNLELNSPEGTLLIAQFSNFVLGEKTPGGFVAWDANTDLVKKSFHYSSYDEKLNQAIEEPGARDIEKNAYITGAMEVQDMSVGAGVYWAQTSKDVQRLYTAQILQKATTFDEIAKLVKDKKIPMEALLSKEQLENVLLGDYELEPMSRLSTNMQIVKALMKLPFDTLEFNSEVVQILSTSYFSNRATTEDTIGLSRFELMEKGNPHLLMKYEDTYLKANDWFNEELKDFAFDIINKIDDESAEKLIGKKGELTEYGQYVVNLFGKNITKYALLKSLARDHFNPRILADGQISYNYKEIKNNTTLKALGIVSVSPEEEAKSLAELIHKGLKKLSEQDVNFVSQAILSQIKGTNALSFRISEAMVDNAGLGLAIRLDAAKDVIDMDAVRNREMTFDEAWDLCIDFWSKYVKGVRSVNPTAYIVAEMTDVDKLMKIIIGDTNNPGISKSLGVKYPTPNDALVAFYSKTGINSEAGYAYTFTDLLKTFALDFEAGWGLGENERPSNFIGKIHELIRERGIDFTRNLFTFADNHDKPSVLHGMALDMRLFFNSFDVFNDAGNLDIYYNRTHREKALQILANVNKYEELPLELQLNIDNPEYFETVSSRAVAMSDLFKGIVNEDLKELASEKEIKLLNQAIQDLTNGNYLGKGNNIDYNTVTIPELKTLEGALKSIMDLGGFSLSPEMFDAVINKAKDPNLMKNFTVYGDFNWGMSGTSAANTNKERLGHFIQGEDDLMQYSTYTVAIAALLRAALASEGVDKDAYNSFINGGKAFIKKFNRETVQETSKSLPILDDPAVADRKNMFGAKDFETVIRMILNQAKYIDTQNNNGEPSNLFEKQDEILKKMFKSSTEPAVQKALMYMSYLSAMPGIATAYLRTIYGALGFDDKTKNISLQNRNVTPFAQLEEGPLKDVRKDYYERFCDAMSIRSRESAVALNGGTPYYATAGVYIYDNKEKGKIIGEKSIDKDIAAYMMQDAYGNTTFSVFNSIGLSNQHRFDYSKMQGDKYDAVKHSVNKDNKYVPNLSKYTFDYIALDSRCSLPEGTEFINPAIGNKVIFTIQKIRDKFLGLARKDGKRIVFDEFMGKNGVAIFERFVTHPRIKNLNIKG